MMDKDKAVWLVKSVGRILGPMEDTEVAKLLESREIYLVDEVAQPLRRWLSIQEVEVFRTVVQDLRKKGVHANFEDTVTLTGGTGTNKTITVTAPLEDSYGDEFTDEIESVTAVTTGSMREIVYDDVKETQRAPPPPPRGSAPLPNYGMRDSAAVQSAATATSRWIVTLAFLGVVGVVSFYAYQQLVQRPKLQEVSSQDDYQRGMAALDAGDYSTALDRLRRFYQGHPEKEDLQLYLGPLMIQLENQTVQGKQMLYRIMEKDPQVAREAWTGIGIAELIDGHHDLATDAFNKALEKDPFYFPALIDQGLLAMQRQDLNKAKAVFESVVNKTDTEPSAFLLLAETLIELAKEEGNKAYLDQALRVLNDFLKNAHDYAQEADFLSLYVYVLKGQTDRATKKAESILDRDPNLTDEHRHNIFIYSRRLSWGSWVKWCEQIQNSMGSNSAGTALWAYCLFRSDRSLEAKKAIENAVNQGPREPLVQAVYSYILHSSNMDDQASVALGKSLEMDSRGEYQLPLILQAQFCERQKDNDCVARSWTQLLQRNPNYLVALAGMAQHGFDAQDLSQVNSFLIRGLSISNDYKPIRKLVQKAELAGIKIVK